MDEELRPKRHTAMVRAENKRCVEVRQCASFGYDMLIDAKNVGEVRAIDNHFEGREKPASGKPPKKYFSGFRF